jgi:hypothetical protein
MYVVFEETDSGRPPTDAPVFPAPLVGGEPS